jgi:hypothetical protein
MTELEERLLSLGRQVDYPATPDFRRAIRPRLVQSAGGRRSVGWRFAVAAAAAIAVAIGTLLAIPPTRDAIAGFFGLKGLIIQRVPSLHTPSPTGTAELGKRLALGRQMTFAQAQATLPYPIIRPQALGDPDLVYLLDPADSHGVALVYLPRADLPASAQTGVGALVIEYPGQVQPNFFLKMLGPDATLENVTINGSAGYWISGRPHDLLYLDPNGNVRDDSLRLAGNTIVWDEGTLTIRIEANLGKADALRLATSTR